MDFAFAYIMGNLGIHTDDDYPYLMEEGYCKEKQVGTWHNEQKNSSEIMRTLTVDIASLLWCLLLSLNPKSSR